MIRPSTKYKRERAFRGLKGELKQKVGRLTNDPTLEAGLGEKISGKIQKRFGELERIVEKS